MWKLDDMGVRTSTVSTSSATIVPIISMHFVHLLGANLAFRVECSHVHRTLHRLFQSDCSRYPNVLATFVCSHICVSDLVDYLCWLACNRLPCLRLLPPSHCSSGGLALNILSNAFAPHHITRQVCGRQLQTSSPSLTTLHIVCNGLVPHLVMCQMGPKRF